MANQQPGVGDCASFGRSWLGPLAGRAWVPRCHQAVNSPTGTVNQMLSPPRPSAHVWPLARPTMKPEARPRKGKRRARGQPVNR